MRKQLDYIQKKSPRWAGSFYFMLSSAAPTCWTLLCYVRTNCVDSKCPGWRPRRFSFCASNPLISTGWSIANWKTSGNYNIVRITAFHTSSDHFLFAGAFNCYFLRRIRTFSATLNNLQTANTREAHWAGSACPAHWTRRTQWASFTLWTDSACSAHWTSGASCACSAHWADWTLRAYRTCTSHWTNRTLRTGITRRTSWARMTGITLRTGITRGTSGTNRTGITLRTRWAGWTNWTGGTRISSCTLGTGITDGTHRTCSTLRTYRTLRTDWPGSTCPTDWA